ncbi:hypothetical protein V1264_017528 [Littorina saxatilis]|uniref:Uncharacterized protein n=1 Tax=Littorina saxatilis TaxID=31220 RepID=A0AAN9BHB8_9CAEN
MQTHISFIIKTCFFHLRRIASIRRYLTHDACVKLVVSLIFSRLDYCNSLLAGLPASSIHGLQRVQNAAARLTLRKTKRDHSTPPTSLLALAPCRHPNLLQTVHSGLQVSQRLCSRVPSILPGPVHPAL